MNFEIIDIYELTSFVAILGLDLLANLLFWCLFTFLVFYFSGLFWGFYTFYDEKPKFNNSKI